MWRLFVALRAGVALVVVAGAAGAQPARIYLPVLEDVRRSESVPRLEVPFDLLRQYRQQLARKGQQRDSVNRALFYEQRARPMLVTIVLVASLRDTTAAAIVSRRPGFTPQDVIAISTPKLSEAVLREAVQQLWRLFQLGGVVPSEPVAKAIHGGPYERNWVDTPGELYRRGVTALLFSDRHEVDGLGRVQAVTASISPP